MNNFMKFSWRDGPRVKAVAFLAFFFLYLPLLILVVYSFNENRLVTEWSGFSTKWFGVAIENDNMLRAMINSLIVACAATTIATLVAIPAAVGFERSIRIPGRNVAEAMILVPLISPEIVTAITTLVFFSAVGLKLGLGNVILAHSVFCVPFAILPIRGRLRDMARDVEDAASDLYASDWQVFTEITLPLLKPGIIAGAALAFVVSLDDFLITLMVADAGSTTLPLYLYSMLRIGVTPEANAAATILMGFSLIFVFVAFYFSQKSKIAR